MVINLDEYKDKKIKGDVNMSVVESKPIEAMPILEDDDAKLLLKQIDKAPNKEVIKKYELGLEILEKIKK